VAVDLRELNGAKPLKKVLITGAYGFIGRFHDPVQDFPRTVQTTMDVLEFARLYFPTSKIVIPSSAAVYGVVDQLPIVEDAPQQPVSPYGFHKRIAEELARSYASFFGIQTAIIRFFSVYLWAFDLDMDDRARAILTGNIHIQAVAGQLFCHHS
jgi:nucleoside-diphosphate-sugar epimerase